MGRRGREKMKFKALIVDDEYPARQELRHVLSEFPQIEVVGEAANGVEARILVEALDYSVLFLDIHMPGMSGLELGEIIKGLEHPPAVVYVTAYDHYAVKAFEVDAIDYLLKPFTEARLQKTVEKLKKYYAIREEIEVTADEEKPLPQEKTLNISMIPVEKQGKTLLLDESEVVYAFTEKDYVYIKTKNDKLLIKFSLKELERRLSPSVFFRTHRCYIVNLKKVVEIIPFFNHTYSLLVADQEKSKVPVSRAQAKKLKKILGM